MKLTGSSDKKISIGDLLSASKSKKKKKKKKASSSSSSSSSSEEEVEDKKRRRRNSSSSEEKVPRKSKPKKRTNSSSDEETPRKRKIEEKESKPYNNYDDDNSDDEGDKRRIKSFGLMKADGSKISLNKSKYNEDIKKDKKKEVVVPKPYEKNKTVRLSEKDKELKRLEMMKNAVHRDKEREKNIHYHREKDRKMEERDKKHGYKDDFVEKQLRVFADVGTVEGRIKSNVYNIQRSNRDMDSNFAKR